LRFEWDEAKRRVNLEKHGVDFIDAAAIWSHPISVHPDRRRDYGEDRFEAIGHIGDLCLVVIFTRRGDVIRIISARTGGRRDRARNRALHNGRNPRDA
jgi:hypothetical protein